MSDEVLIALIGAAAVVGAAAVTAVFSYMTKRLERPAKFAAEQLQGNGRGTMLAMVTDLHRDMGKTDARLTAIEDEVKTLDSMVRHPSGHTGSS